MRDSTSYADQGLKMWDTFALASVLTLKLDPDRLGHSDAQPQVSTDLNFCKLFNPFYNLNCSA
jgi:hypothetical protein